MDDRIDEQWRQVATLEPAGPHPAAHGRVEQLVRHYLTREFEYRALSRIRFGETYYWPGESNPIRTADASKLEQLAERLSAFDGLIGRPRVDGDLVIFELTLLNRQTVTVEVTRDAVEELEGRSGLSNAELIEIVDEDHLLSALAANLAIDSRERRVRIDLHAIQDMVRD